MDDPVSCLFDIPVWAPALEKYGAVVRLSVALFDANQHIVCGPLPITPLAGVFRAHGYDPGLFTDCARQCLAQSADRRPPVIVTAPSGLAVAGVSLVRDGQIVGAVVAGYALVGFCDAAGIARLARESATPFRELWNVARAEQPVPTRRLLLTAELLQVLADALLRENDLRRHADEASVRFAHVARHDPLTGLPNRRLLADRLGLALALAQRHKRPLAVLFLDIDRFKSINDSLGHIQGDALLLSVARTLSRSIRESDTVSRHGGDEFVVLLAELERPEDAALCAQTIIAAVAQPLTLAGHEVHVTVSIGISVYPDDGADVETLLTTADMALYHAKEHGRNGYQFFKHELHVRAVERRAIESGLHSAIEQGQFELHYQPKVDLITGAVVGAEALIRWRHPQHGMVQPARFVPVAEECGLIKPIGRWVAREACRQAQAWQDAGLPAIPVSINVSAIEFQDKAFVDHLTAILHETGLGAQYLEVELTESTLMSHVASSTAQLHALKALGIQLAIDDFGTGWSSLSYLRHFPIDAVKIDASFVREITARPDSAPIVTAVINMGRSLRHRVVAEGIETQEQLAFLQDERCPEGQGYLWSRPLVAPHFAKLLQAGAIPVTAP